MHSILAIQKVIQQASTLPSELRQKALKWPHGQPELAAM